MSLSKMSLNKMPFNRVALATQGFNKAVLNQQAPSKKRPMSTALRLHQGGSMLVLALFVIIVFALLGLALTKVLSASSQSTVYEVYGQRALNAARSGAEAQIALAFPLTGSGSCASSPVFTFSGVPGLENCQYSAQCVQKNVVDTESAVSADHYQFTSTGQCSAGNIIVSRTVYVDAMQ